SGGNCPGKETALVFLPGAAGVNDQAVKHIGWFVVLVVRIAWFPHQFEQLDNAVAAARQNRGEDFLSVVRVGARELARGAQAIRLRFGLVGSIGLGLLRRFLGFRLNVLVGVGHLLDQRGDVR